MENITPFKDIEAFENFIEAIEEHYDEGSTIIQGAEMLIETDKKSFQQSQTKWLR